jgi:hypothetical protein
MFELITHPGFVVIAIAAIGGWVFTTWLRVKHGYPLEGSWGQALKPVQTNEAVERLKLLTSENAQLQAELGALKDRVQVLERIATDDGRRLSREIDNLRH